MSINKLNKHIVNNYKKNARLAKYKTDFSLIETFLLKDGHYFLLEYHLQRLIVSAHYFNFKYCLAAINEKLAKTAAIYNKQNYRVRLLLNKYGEVTLTINLFPKEKPLIKQIGIATKPIDRTNPFHYHKTTNREIYDCHTKNLISGQFDILLWNDCHQVTEFTIGNIVVEKDGQKFTPPIKCGLLPGTFRHYLLTTKKMTERIIFIEELSSFDKIYFINSLRGWVEVKI